MPISEHYYAVIIAGGGGTRLWPKSRKNSPKQFLKLFGNRSLIQTVFDAISPIIPSERILVITNQDYLEQSREQLPEIPTENWLCEPFPKGTATAMAVATAYIHKRDENAVIMNLWSDPMIPSVEGFQKAVLSVLSATENDDLIAAIVEKPAFAHTGLGYIHAGPQLEIPKYQGQLPVLKSLEFKEKPDLETATKYFESGEYFWNTGMYAWSSKNILNAFAKYTPKYRDAIDQLMSAIGTPKENSVLHQVFEEAENTTIDYAVSEKADNMAMVAGNFGWNDIGDWKVVYDVSGHDQDGNTISNPDNFIGIDNKNSLIETNGRLIVAIGLENVAIVDTGDVILVTNKDRSQDVKKAVEKLKEEKKDQYL